MNVLFSVVIANYNYGRFIEDAIVSVTGQCSSFVVCPDGVHRLLLPTGEFVELIVCDGGSTDNSVDVIRRYSNSIAWWCSEHDRGQSDAFNKGFSHATGRFLTWLNADDVFTGDAFETIRQLARQNPNCRWLTGSSLYADLDLRVTKCFCSHAFWDFRAKHGFLSVWAPSSFFEKSLWEEVGGVDVNLHYLMDIDLWHRFFLRGARYMRTRKNIFAYRHHEDSKMSGADFRETEKNLSNQRKAREERRLIDARYGIGNGLAYKLSRILNLSLVDVGVAVVRTMRWRGRDARTL